MVLVDIAGFIGASLLLGAFFQSSRGTWNGHMMRYQVINLAAGILLVYYTLSKDAIFATIINIVWIVVALIGITRLLTTAPRRSKRS